LGHGLPAVHVGHANRSNALHTVRAGRSALPEATEDHELDGDVVATSFKNDTSEVELLGHHKAIGRMKGSIGGTVLTRAFATDGEEVLSPPVDQKGFATYVYEEIAATPHVQVQFWRTRRERAVPA
jgi:hypothetical protein